MRVSASWLVLGVAAVATLGCPGESSEPADVQDVSKPSDTAGASDGSAEDASDALGPTSDLGDVNDAGPTAEVSPTGCPDWLDAAAPETLDELAALFLFHQDLGGAICAVDRLLAAQPEHPLAINNHAFVAIARGDLDDAIAALEAARAQWPGAPYLARNLAIAYARQDRFDEAIEQAEALEDLQPELCVTGPLLEALRLLAGAGDEAEARDTIMVQCGDAELWDRLATRGVVAPRNSTPFCGPIFGIPDRASVCPHQVDGAGCMGPSTFTAPQCDSHPERCVEEPYFINYAPGSSPMYWGHYGVVASYAIAATQLDCIEYECGEDEYDCACLRQTEQPPRSLVTNVSGSRHLNPLFTQDMPVMNEVNQGTVQVVFPLFPGRLIHASADGEALGCGPMSSPFYRFRDQDDYFAAANETVRKLEEAGAFAISVDLSVAGLEVDSHWKPPGGWTCDGGGQGFDLERCESVQTSVPGALGYPAALPKTEECQEPYADSFHDPTAQTDMPWQAVFIESEAHHFMCEQGPLGTSVGELLATVAGPRVDPYTGETVERDLFVVPMGLINLSVSWSGSLTVAGSVSPATFRVSANPWTGAFDVRAGAGPSLDLGGIASPGYALGIGASGDGNAVRRLYIYDNVGVCLGNAISIDRDRILLSAEVGELADAVRDVFGGGAHGANQSNHAALEHRYPLP